LWGDNFILRRRERSTCKGEVGLEETHQLAKEEEKKTRKGPLKAKDEEEEPETGVSGAKGGVFKRGEEQRSEKKEKKEGGGVPGGNG